MRTSPRPKARPDVPTVSEDVAIAMAEGIDGALEEATAAPAPAGTLEFQAEAMAEASVTPDAPAVAEDALLAAAELCPQRTLCLPPLIRSQRDEVALAAADATVRCGTRHA